MVRADRRGWGTAHVGTPRRGRSQPWSTVHTTSTTTMPTHSIAASSTRQTPVRSHGHVARAIRQPNIRGESESCRRCTSGNNPTARARVVGPHRRPTRTRRSTPSATNAPCSPRIRACRAPKDSVAGGTAEPVSRRGFRGTARTIRLSPRRMDSGTTTEPVTVFRQPPCSSTGRTCCPTAFLNEQKVVVAKGDTLAHGGPLLPRRARTPRPGGETRLTGWSSRRLT